MGTHPIFESDFDCLTDLEKTKMNRLINQIGSIAMGVGVGVAAVNSVLYNVDAGCRGVIFDRFQGVLQDVKDEGTHFYIPMIQTPIIFDVKTQPKTLRTSTGSKDLQTVNLTLRVLFRPVTKSLPSIYTELGEDYYDVVLPSITNEILKAVVANYNADELITRRIEVTKEIQNALISRAGNFNIILDDVALTHLTFSQEFTTAVEQKQIAEQQAEQARYKVERAEHIKRANIIKAEGDAQAAQLVADAMNECGEGLIELRKLEASLEISRDLSRNQRITYLPSQNQGMLLNLGIDR